MANLAIVGTHSTNGVAAIHSELLRTKTVPDFAELFPDRFNNKTNGVTPRRWLLLANPDLAKLLTDAVGDGWVTDLSRPPEGRPAGDGRRLPGEVPRGQARREGAVRGLDQGDRRDHPRPRHAVRRADQAHPRVQAAAPERDPVRGLVQPAAGEPEARRAAADGPVRGQGGPGVPPREGHHQAHHQHRPGGERRPGDARQAAGRVPAELLLHARRAPDPGGRRVRADLDRRVRGERHEQHEVHDERGPDRRHPGRGEHRDRRGGRRGELLHVRPDRRAGARRPRLVQPAVALRERAGDAGRPGPDLRQPLQPGRAGHLRADPRDAADQGRLLHAPRRPDGVRARRSRRWRRCTATARRGPTKAIHNVARSGKFSSDRTIAEYASEIWGASPARWTDAAVEAVFATLEPHKLKRAGTVHRLPPDRNEP